jgi:L-lactate dehydrogenase complex protein LldG
MSARDDILGRIGSALGRQSGTAAPASIIDRLHGGRRSTLPSVSEDLIGTLVQNMESVLMSVVRLQTVADCVDAVQWYMDSQGIDISQPGAVTVAPALSSLGWPEHFASGPATGVERVSVTPCIAAVAETGSIVTASGALTPANLNFLPETHVIVVHESQVVRYVDDVFTGLRAQPQIPRAVNFITGPSRTADIEQTLEIGAHGPRRTHVLLVSADPQ